MVGNGKYLRIQRNDNIFNDIKYDNRKCLTIYVKTNFLEYVFNNIKDINKKFIIVSGCADSPITYEKYIHKPINVIKWYAENVNYEVKDLIPLPMGSLSATWIGNNWKDSELYNHKDFKFVQVNNEEKRINNLAFMCFSIGTNPNHRKQVYDYFDNKKWVTNLCKEKTGEYLNDEIFHKNIYNHSFVISPYGNGIDCGRTWMTIQLGAIPIMPYHYCFLEWSKNLPIILYKDINEITEEYLLKRLDEFKNKTINYEYLRISYWKSVFEKIKI